MTARLDAQPTISREELHAALSGGEDLQLVFALGAGAYAAAHIPGSLHFSDPAAALRALDPQVPVVLYCSDHTCSASITGQYLLIQKGFADVRRLAGGLAAWMDASYPVEGRQAPDSDR